MNNRILITLGLMFCSLLALAETGTQQLQNLPKNPMGYSQIKASQLLTIIDNKDFSLVNVHVPYNGEIPGTNANIAYNDIDRISRLFPDKSAPLVIYCRSGSMSYQTAVGLVKLGYEHVVDVTGGYNAWRSLGEPLTYR